MKNIVSRWSIPSALLAASLTTSCSQEANQLLCAALDGELSCQGFIQAGASISGQPGIDAFFVTSGNFRGEAAILRARLQTAVGDMVDAVGLEATGKLKEDVALLVEHVQDGFGGKIQGGLTLEFVPPQCEINAEVQVQAAASCDVEVDPGTLELECRGECIAKADVMVDCDGSAEIRCRGTAPRFECTGSCTGTCDLEPGGAECEGTCNGTCELDGTVECAGECMGDVDGDNNCTGECDVRSGARCEGTCMGSCEITAPDITCNGECKGECLYTPPEGGCEASANVSCEASADASVRCEGECRGEFEPPDVTAECEATARAEADFSAECRPPEVGITFNFSAELEGDLEAQLEFEVQMVAFGRAYGEFVASLEKLDLIVEAGEALVNAGASAVQDGLERIVDARADFGAQFRASCAIAELPVAVNVIGSGVASLEDSASAASQVTSALGG